MGLPGIAPDAKSDPFALDEIETDSKYTVSKTGNGPKPFKVTDSDTGEVIGMYKTRVEAEAKVRELDDPDEEEGESGDEGMFGDSMDSEMGGGGMLGASKDELPMFSHGTGKGGLHRAFKSLHATLHARGND